MFSARIGVGAETRTPARAMPEPVPTAAPLAPLFVCSVREPGRPGFGLPGCGPRRPGGAFVLPGAGTVSAVPLVATTGGGGGVVVRLCGGASVITTPSSLTTGG